MEQQLFNQRKGCNCPPDAVNIGRGTPFGNPYIIGIHGNRDEVCDLFEQNTLPNIPQSVLETLRNKKLKCWCVPLRCHGEAILRRLKETA